MSNAERIESLYAAFAEGDVPTVLGAMTPDIAWREAEGNPYEPDGQAWTGPDAILQNLFMRLGEDWVGFSATPSQIHEAGDTVVVEGRYGGVVTESGAPLDAQFCHVWTMENGQIAAFQQYTDTAQFQTLLGATKSASR